METQGHLIVDVARLDKDGEDFRGETAEGLLELGKDEYISPRGGMLYDLFVERLGDELLVRGKVSQELSCVCSRCGEDFETEAEDDDFVRSFPLDAKTEYVDLTEEVREAIILAFPSYPVCDEGCLGLCPVCGANLNKGSCSCKGSDPKGGLADLDGLLKNNPGILRVSDGQKSPSI